ncbi:hypothetical protein [Embleya sp. NPDC001921]
MRLRNRDGLPAVAGGALPAGAWPSVDPDGFKGFTYLCLAAAVLGAAVLPWSARLTVPVVRGPLAVLAAALGVLASVELARDIRARRVPESAPRFLRHPTQPG